MSSVIRKPVKYLCTECSNNYYLDNVGDIISTVFQGDDSIIQLTQQTSV